MAGQTFESEETTATLVMAPGALRAAWRRTIGKPIPRHLPQGLLMRILAYRQQAHQHGDLSRHAITELKRCLQEPDRRDGASTSSPRPLKPSTVLVREHDGMMHQVRVTTDGFAWQEKSYASLSAVAFAITSTRWNRRRFFGLDGTFRS